MKFRHFPVLLGLLLLVSPAFGQGIVFNEGTDGELSDNNAAPTPVTFGIGVNTIEGALGGLGANGGGGASNGNDADIFTFTLAPGQIVTSITTTRSDEAFGFIGYVNSNSIADFTDGDSLGAALDGGALFGNAEVLGTATGNPDLAGLPDLLTAGDHTFILQETVTPVDFSISFTVAQAVPEPSSAALLGGLALLGFARRRRS